jgi:hypothetical protein
MNMNIKLSRHLKHRYTDREQLLFSMLLKSKRISTNDIIQKLFRDELTGRQNAIATMNHFSRKLMENDEKFIIEKSKRRGPRPIEFWLERKRA